MKHETPLRAVVILVGLAILTAIVPVIFVTTAGREREFPPLPTSTQEVLDARTPGLPVGIPGGDSADVGGSGVPALAVTPSPAASPAGEATVTGSAVGEPQVSAASATPDTRATTSVAAAPSLVTELLPEMHAAEDHYGLPRGVIAAMSIWESGGGAKACGFNITGYTSCAQTFSSYSEGIWVTAQTLASYVGDLTRRLCTWVAGPNGPSPCDYAARVIATMADYR